MRARYFIAMSSLGAGLVACSGKDHSDAPVDGMPGTDPAYVLMHTVRSPEGRQNYVLATPTLEIGEFDNGRTLEVSGASRTFALGGAAFVADAESLSIRRFEVDDAYSLVPSGTVSLANYGITYFDTGFTLLDAERAWYMASEAGGRARPLS